MATPIRPLCSDQQRSEQSMCTAFEERSIRQQLSCPLANPQPSAAPTFSSNLHTNSPEVAIDWRCRLVEVNIIL